MDHNITFAGGRAKWVFQKSDGNVVLYHDGVAVWATNTILEALPPPPLPPPPTSQNITFSGGRAKFAFQNSDGNVVLYHDGVPVWATNTVLNTLPSSDTEPADPARWRVNFLAAQGYEMGDNRNGGQSPLSYLEWDATKQAQFRHDYVTAGHTHLPISFMPPVGWESNPDPHIAKVQEVVNDFAVAGMVLCHMLVTDRPGHEVTFDEAKRWAEVVINHTHQSNVVYVLGWEQNSIDRGRGFLNDDFKTRDFVRHVRSLTNADIWIHFTPRWWGGSGIVDGVEGAGYSDEREYWIKGMLPAGATGLLYQSEWDNTDDEAFDLFLDYPWSGEPIGILGRMRDLIGAGCVWFEHSRFTTDYKRRTQRLLDSGREINGF